MTRFATLAEVGFVLSTACAPNQEPAARAETHAYYFYEATGQNQFILVEGVERAIKFDDTSNDAAVQALYDLRWNVTYPNSKGEITLLGTYHPDTHTFSLHHWFLPSTFLAHPPGDWPIERPSPESCDTLEQVHFQRELDEDPRIYQLGPDGLLTADQKDALYEWYVGRLFF